jgi:hypothetical protein
MNAIFNFVKELVQNPVQTVVRAVTQFVSNPVGTIIGVAKDIFAPQGGGSGGSSGSNQSSGGSGGSNRSSGGRDDADGRGANEARQREAQRRAEESRRRREERFDRDVEQQEETAAALPEFVGILTPIYPDVAALKLLANSNPLAKDVWLALTHEGKPDHMADFAWLNRFARWGWNKVDDEIALKLVAGKTLLTQHAIMPQQYQEDTVSIQAFNPSHPYTPEEVEQLIYTADQIMTAVVPVDDELTARAQLILLQYRYGVTLTTIVGDVERENIWDPNTVESPQPWDVYWEQKQAWSPDSVNNVYGSIQAIAQRLWESYQINGNQYPAYVQEYANAGELFRFLMGPVDIRLSDRPVQTYGEGFTIDPEQGYRVDETGNIVNVIKFFSLQGSLHDSARRPREGVPWHESDWFQYNLAHELGHVLANRVRGFAGSSMNKFTADYQQSFAEANLSTLGWGEQAGQDWLNYRNAIWSSGLRQPTRQVGDNSINPHEDWADMFMYWVYQNQLDLNRGTLIPRTDQSLLSARIEFMNATMNTFIERRHFSVLPVEEIVVYAGWYHEEAHQGQLRLPIAMGHERHPVQMRNTLSGTAEVDINSFNEDWSISAGVVRPNTHVTILGVSQSDPRWILVVNEDNQVGWVLKDLMLSGSFDFGGTSLNWASASFQRSDNARDELLGLYRP